MQMLHVETGLAADDFVLVYSCIKQLSWATKSTKQHNLCTESVDTVVFLEFILIITKRGLCQILLCLFFRGLVTPKTGRIYECELWGCFR